MKRLPKPLQNILPIAIVVVTVILFVYLFATHPEYRHTLATTNPWILILVGVLYAVLMLCSNWVYDITLRLCGERLSRRENILLTCYSTIVNYFGPLQSGPGVRAAYVKQKRNVKYRDYTMASLVYYAIYAVISAIFILVGSGTHWLIALTLLGIVCISSTSILYFAYKRIVRSGQTSKFRVTPRLGIELTLATLSQLSIVALIYAVELRAVHTGVDFTRAVVYGGAANFSLFVSLTPGAIGFREAFLEFSRQLHHIPTSGILAASVIDRSVYVAFLGALFVLTLGLHLGDRFNRKPTNKSVAIDD